MSHDASVDPQTEVFGFDIHGGRGLVASLITGGPGVFALLEVIIF